MAHPLYLRIDNYIRTRRLLQPGDRIAIAVSGGADSVFLLHAVHALATDWNWTLTILHANHELRGQESEADAIFIQHLADSLNLPCRIQRLPVPPDGNLEQNARRLRHAFFRTANTDAVATGHTRSDQAETVLFRFLRGSGTSGFAAIRPRTKDGLVRPLLEIGRDEIRAFLAEKDIPWRDDSSNASPAFDRNRIRHHLLPQLTRDWNPALEQTLARMAAWALDEEAYWQQQIALPTPDRAGAIVIDTMALPESPAVRRRLFRAAIERVKGDLLGIGFDHIDRILQMARSPEGHDRFIVGGCDLLRSFHWIRVAPYQPGGDIRNFRYPLRVPSVVDVPGCQPAISVELTESFELSECVYNSGVGVLDWDRLNEPLSLRNWRPGDVYMPSGCAASRKLKDLFQEARVPLWDRRNWPVLEMGETIVWSRRFGPASAFAANSQSRNVLVIRECPQPAAPGGTEVSQCSLV